MCNFVSVGFVFMANLPPDDLRQAVEVEGQGAQEGGDPDRGLLRAQLRLQDAA